MSDCCVGFKCREDGSSDDDDDNGDQDKLSEGHWAPEASWIIVWVVNVWGLWFISECNDFLLVSSGILNKELIMNGCVDGGLDWNGDFHQVLAADLYMVEGKGGD